MTLLTRDLCSYYMLYLNFVVKEKKNQQYERKQGL